MSVLQQDRLEILGYLKRFVQRIRQLAADSPGAFGSEMLDVAEQIARDITMLEVELIEAGYISRPANQA